MIRANNIRYLLTVLLVMGATAMSHAQSTPHNATPDEEKNGITFNGTLYKPQSRIKIGGNVFGGGDQANVEGNTFVTINKGEFGGEIFGGGNGALHDGTDGVHAAGEVKASADVGTHLPDGSLKEGTGDTHVTINGGEIVYYFGSAMANNHNIYGGGNEACNVAGSTYVTMNKGMITSWSFVSSDYAIAAWQSWYDNHKSKEKRPVAAVLGAGYGANTDVAVSTHVDINFGTPQTVAYSKSELESINRHIVRTSPNPKLSALFVTGVLGGGYNGTVGAYSAADKAVSPTKDEYTASTNVSIKGSPYMFDVFGGGLGSAEAAATDPYSRVGAVLGSTKVSIEGGFIFGSVFGGGAGIHGSADVTTPFVGKMPYIHAAQVFRETDVTIDGLSTVIIGNVYGGGDIANTGWYTAAARPTTASHLEQANKAGFKTDHTTSVTLLGGNIMGQAFGGANGRKNSEIPQARLVGAVIGSTNITLGDSNGQGATVWSSIYGGGNVGCVYSCADMAADRDDAASARAMTGGVTDGCTNVVLKGGKAAHDTFAGGFGDNSGEPTSADISGNTFVYLEHVDLEFNDYWDASLGQFQPQSSAESKRNTASDVCHNLYGGGNVACVVKGNSYVNLIGAPTVPADFYSTDYYRECIANVAKPHFSSFGGGFGSLARVTGNAYSDITLNAGSGLHSIVGGGMNGPVDGTCMLHVGNDPNALVHYVYGGGYYAPCGGTQLNITRGTILDNVFGGAIMGNINTDGASTDIATSTTIGLKAEGPESTFTTAPGHGYTYANQQNEIVINGNVYGANDVSGTVNGIAQLTIYGGEVKGNVYGAGNGDHLGYYVPGQLLYNLGEHGADNYFNVDHGTPETTGKTYVGRPQTIGGVTLTLEGNTPTERVVVKGQVFGGGNSCTIGSWNKDLLNTTYVGNPHLVRDDPDYFLGGGQLTVNLGSHVTIGRSYAQLYADSDGENYISKGENVSGLYMGCSGKYLATQTGAKTNNHYHHFFDAHSRHYYPGFAVDDENGVAMDRETQLLPFQAYMNNILIWTDDVTLNVANQDGSATEDTWLANFVGGGFRGSMRTKTTTGSFDYALPEGITVSHAIVAGAYNAHIQYHYFATDADGNFIDADGDGSWDYATTVPAGWVEGIDYIKKLYEDSEHPDTVTGILRYNYNGGMLSENSTGINSSEKGHHIHQVHADPRADETAYATAYFEPMSNGTDDPAAEDAATRAKLFTANKHKALMHLDLECALEPEVMTDSDGKYVHGGNVYGGCFLSGFVEGDSWVDYRCWLSGNCTDPYFFSKDNNMHIYDEAANVERNDALSAYGAGFGTDTHSMGDVYLSIKAIEQQAGGDADKIGHFPYIFNAFGGSNMGEVDGNVNVYYAVGKQGTLLGSLYGGSYKGEIHGNTFVELAEGFVNNVYGGSRQADIGGAAHVWAYDGKARGIETANHLIICNLYGGNDIAGTINGTMPAHFTESKWTNTREPISGKRFNTYVELSADDNSADRGFPLVGSAFAGGNGEKWTAESGVKPEVTSALIEIDGGSTLRAFGGGNMATVTGQTFIFTDAKSVNFAKVGFTEYQKNIVQKIFFRDVTVGYKWENDTLTMERFHVARLFGGNNLAAMDIQPTWNLVNGRLDNVYSGGNMGDMTYYNAAGKPATRNGNIGETAGVEYNADGSNANYTPRGLCITIDQPDIYIGSLFGGCRLSDVKPTPKTGEPAWPEGNDGDPDDGQDFYGATVNVLDGYIENVYGGNDISGTVHYGTNVNISGAVSGNVYGSGNGFYLYKWDNGIDWASTESNPYQSNVIEEFNEEHKELIYHVKPLANLGGNTANNTQKLLTINSYRPMVTKAFLNIGGLEHYPAGTSNPKRVAYVKGNVFCGGNASTVSGLGEVDNSFTKFKIGSYVTLNGVFMGSDGKSFTNDEHIKKFANLNGITDMGAASDPSSFLDYDGEQSQDAQHNPILLNIYMMAVDMKAQPKDFNLNLPLKEAHIGTYCGGGNRGSMLVDKTVNLPFHHDIIIYDKIVAACLDANVKYNQEGEIITSWGGYTRAIADRTKYGNTKMKLDIASQFVPLVMDVPADKQSLNEHNEDFETAKMHDFLYDNRTKGVKYDYAEFNDLFQGHWESQLQFESEAPLEIQWKEAPGIYAPSCNIYGGCYQSGEVEGDIELNLHSNMLRYVNKEDLEKSLAQNIPCFNVYGAGFGQDSHVWGNVSIHMDRSLDSEMMGVIGSSTLSEELKALLGGESKWNIQNQPYQVVPTGLDRSYPSFNNVIGGARNGKLIGNTKVEIRSGLVYSDVAGGCYASDMYGSTHVIVGYPQYWECNTTGEYLLDRGDKWNTDKKDADGHNVIKSSVKYLKGDLVPNNVYEMIKDRNDADFTDVSVQPENWDNVFIKIGKGVYGGGYSLANSTAASAGSITTNKLKEDAVDLHPHNFDGRWQGKKTGLTWTGTTLTGTTSYGGNSSIMVADEEGGLRDHISISTMKATVAYVPASGSVIGKFIKEDDGSYTHQGDGAPIPGETYYSLTGEGGIYGDGHLTFCEGFRAADVTRYGYAQGTPQHPALINTFQRMDLLSVTDCCLMLQGAQDFATDQIDATIYSITRVNELRMKSTLDPDAPLGQISSQTNSGGVGAGFTLTHQRNYLAFFNNVHYLGSIISNDSFDDAPQNFHDANGALGTRSYKTEKAAYISAYDNSPKDAAATETFKKRNVGTARNAIGVNNGYCLRIQNQEYIGTGESKQSRTYYGPIVGVCEIKLLTLTQGEGGGYVYADNIHADENNFLNTSGNFVFPGVVNSDPSVGDQYIVDDCFMDHFGTNNDLTAKHGELDEAHYWYVEGNKYFYNTTLTGFTYQEALDFNLIENDPNIILSGMQNGSKLNIKRIEWLSAEAGYHRDGYEAVLPNSETDPEKIDDYEFDIEIGGIGTKAWKADMPRHSAGSVMSPLTTDKTIRNDEIPQFNIHLRDSLDNSGNAAYINHLDEPELVKIYLEGQTQDEIGNWQTYEYTITLNIVYLQGPTFEGGVLIENCALPGELIGFTSEGIKVKTPELMPVTAASWQIVPLQQINEHGEWKWDITRGIIIPEDRYNENLDGNIEGTIPALYKQNGCTIAYIFTAGGKDFPVMPKQTAETPQENSMIVVHNYHRMKDVVARNLQIETMPSVPNNKAGVDYKMAEAKIYLEDETDLRAFISYLNMATAAYTDDDGVEHAGNEKNIPVGLMGLDVIMLNDITLTQPLPDITQQFAGTFHGDGYHIDLGPHAATLFGDMLSTAAGSTGKVYNLGLIGGTICSTDTKAGNGIVNGTHTVNCYEYTDNDDTTYGRLAYDLSHAFNPTTDHNRYADYVATRYANGDYQYATTDRVWSLRTNTPNYGSVVTRHDTSHTHDAARWNEGKGANVPLHDGTRVVEDKTVWNAAGTESTIYSGLPIGYANDYLFFGQHLDRTGADAYPVHLSPVASADADASKGGNRIYKTSGFYQSNEDEGFCYNRDAWALQPTLTAIDFTIVAPEIINDKWGYTIEKDNAVTTPLAFHVDSNADYCDPYDNKAYGHVSQNLLVYREADYYNEPGFTGSSDDYNAIFAEGIYGNDAEEADVRYHLLKNKLEQGALGGHKRSSAFDTDYFHLVDCQDFYAPMDFFVNERGWYERRPQDFRTVDTGYDTAKAWEGLCLPFPFVTRVMGEKAGNELSHFYGVPTAEMLNNPALNDRTLHHEYWLAGLTAAAGGEAGFARPSLDGNDDELFNDYRQYWWTSYDQANTYYRTLPDYLDHYGTRDDDNWYASAHSFSKYPHITTGIPYLVAFPGASFYEFDLTGQKITMEFVSPRIGAEDPIYCIPATGSSDEYFALIGHPDLTTTVGTHSHVGTYLHVTADTQHIGINDVGDAFEVTDGRHILPFRTYMTTTSASVRRITIRGGEAEEIEVDDETPSIEDVTEPTMHIYGQGTTIVVESNYDTELHIYTTEGRLCKTVHVAAGKNIYEGFLPITYIVGGKKLHLN